MKQRFEERFQRFQEIVERKSERAKNSIENKIKLH